MIGLCFGVIESPDTTDWSTMIVIKPTLMKNPDSNNIAFKLGLLITIPFWWLVFKRLG